MTTVKAVSLSDSFELSKNWTRLVNPILQINKFALRAKKGESSPKIAVCVKPFHFQVGVRIIYETKMEFLLFIYKGVYLLIKLVKKIL